VTAQETADAPNVLCVFTIVVDGDGVPRVHGATVEGARPYREATELDVRRALLELVADFSARASAEYVTQALLESGVIAVPEPSVSERVSAALADAAESD